MGKIYLNHLNDGLGHKGVIETCHLRIGEFQKKVMACYNGQIQQPRIYYSEF